MALIPRASAVLCCALLLVGCGRSTPPPPSTPPEPETQSQPPPPPMRQELSEPTIRMVDPAGRWTFELKAQSATAAGLHGPYEMKQVDATYQETGRPDVFITADTASVDESSRRVVFQGHVKLTSGAWELQAARIDYNLDSGEVVASGQPKWIPIEPPATPGESPPTKDRGG